MKLGNSGDLGDAVISDTGGTRTDGSDLGAIYQVTTIVPAVQGVPSWWVAGNIWSSPNGAQPFATTTPLVQDAYWPFHFAFTYPPNNFKLTGVRLVIDASRDNSDTEGVFWDGVMSSCGASINTGLFTGSATLFGLYRNAQCTSGAVAGDGFAVNMSFMDFALKRYKSGTAAAPVRNSFYVDVEQIVTTTPALPVTGITSPTAFDFLRDSVKDGQVYAATGDDLAIFSAFMMTTGLTLSKTALSCSDEGPYSFQNRLLHNDGKALAQVPFDNGTVPDPAEPDPSPVTRLNPNESFAGAPSTTTQTVEFFFEPDLPKVDATAITLTQGQVVLTLRRNALSVPAAIFINGIAIGSDGFDVNRGNADYIESWEAQDSTAQEYWNTLVNGLPTDSSNQARTIDLISMLGATRVRDLLLQGKLHIAFTGSVSQASGGAATSTRTFGTAVAGPELVIAGNYAARTCLIPNNPDSPLSDSFVPDPGGLDTTSPVITSLQAINVAATTASIIFLTDESSTTQVKFWKGGISSEPADGPSNLSPTSHPDHTNAANRNTFHQVNLTGLASYSTYTVRAITKDTAGNTTISSVASFVTKR